MITFDQATVDSSGAFLIGELERLDQTLNLPLVGYTWTRDIQLREDVSIADDISSWTNTSFGAAGTGANPNGKNWVGKDSTAIAGVNVDISKDGNPLNLWGMELGWTVVELAAAQQVGRPIDTQKYDGMQLKWQMDNDEQVYIGDDALGLKGLANLVGVTLNNAPKTWANSTNDEILDSVNSILSNAWAASGYSIVPSDLRIPPEQYSLLASRKVSEAGNQSLLTYLAVNTIAFHQNGVPLEIKAVKWLKGRGVGGKDRMIAYTNDKKYVRYPLVPLQSVPVQYRGLYQYHGDLMSKYTELITNYHATKPLFFDHIDLSTRPLIDVSSTMSGLITAFDIDTAVGVQLDILGLWIGRSRIVSQPISGVYFSWDTDGLGYDQGIWQGPYDPDSGYTTLSDETYRIILKAKIAINNWDGRNDSLPPILDAATAGSGLRMQIVDNQDMTISVWVFPETDISDVSLELIAAIKQGYLTVKSAGVWAGDVETPSVETPSEGSKFFGFDMDNEYIGGFDVGAWGTIL